MPGPSQSENAAGNSLSNKVKAAPFIPASSPQIKVQQTGSFPESAVKAQPFVPGAAPFGGGTAVVKASPLQGHTRTPPTKLAPNAVAFVPKQPDSNSSTKGGRGTAADGTATIHEGPAMPGSAGGNNSTISTANIIRAGAASPAPTPSPTASTPPPSAGRATAGRGGGGRAGGGSSAGGGASPSPAQFTPGRSGGTPGRGGGRSGPTGGPAAASPSASSPSPMMNRGGRGGGRGSGSGGGFMGMGPMGHMGMGPAGGSAGGGGMQHLGAAAGMMAAAAAAAAGGGGGFPGPLMGGGGGHMSPMALTSFGTGGGSHLPSYRARDVYLAGPGRAYVGLHFVEEGLRQQLQHRAYMTAAQWHDESADESGPAAPYRLGPYHTLYPLEEGAMGPPAAGSGGEGGSLSAALGLRTLLVKGISIVDGSAAALRRLDPKQVAPTPELLSRARDAVESWSPLANHPNLVGLRAAFIAMESLTSPPQQLSGAVTGGGPLGGGGGGGMGSGGGVDGAGSLVFAHDFHPGAVSLAAAHLMPQMSPAGLVSAPTPPHEELVWSYAVQLTSAMRAAHGCGLLLRPACLHPSKVLLTGFGRLRVGSVGVLDVLCGEQPGPEEMQMLMRQDISAMGSLLLTLCCAGGGPAPSLELVASAYSPELVRLLGALLGAVEGGPLCSWRGLVAALADRAFTELDGAGVGLDSLVGELSKEAENGRLLRLLAKLNFVIDRPTDGSGHEGVDASWSESGDRAVLRLFRDFVFHGAAPDSGAPLLDWGLLVEALNKLDAGVHEEILLLGRDGQSMLVVTYADIKRCLESAFSELRAASASGPRGGPGGAGAVAGRLSVVSRLQ